MGRAPCCSKVGLHRGPWTAREDTLLVNYIHKHGEGQWRTLPKNAGLLRSGKSCRLRWVNYLRPDIKRGNITQDEKELILRLHSLLGNRWSLIAGRLPGRTDNEIKNYWNSHLSKRLANVNDNTTPKLTDDEDQKFTKSEYSNSRGDRFEKVTKIYDKIHQPKPIRVSPSSVTRNNGMVMLSTGSFSSWPHQLEDVSIDCRNFSHQECFDLCSSPVPAKDDNNDMLHKIYKEYQQLLNKPDQDQNLDSFVNSLLV